MQPTSSSPSAHTGNLSNMPPKSRARFERIFNEQCEGKPYLTGIEAAIILLDSRLHKNVLSHIWEQADVTRDGRFSCDEFCHAMWLIDLEKNPYPTPIYPNPPQYTNTSAQAGQYASASQPAYSQQPYAHAAHPPPYSIPPGQPLQPSSGPTYAQGYTAYQRLTLDKLEMFEPMICQGCDLGLVPNDVVYNCDQCKDGVSRFCEACHNIGKCCYHQVAPSKLEAGNELKNEDKDGDFGFGLKCDGCKTKFKQGMLCWHCKRCFDPNFCKDCWRKRDKRCKHAAQGKVELRRVGRSSASAGDVLEVVGGILGG